MEDLKNKKNGEPYQKVLLNTLRGSNKTQLYSRPRETIRNKNKRILQFKQRYLKLLPENLEDFGQVIVVGHSRIFEAMTDVHLDNC